VNELDKQGLYLASANIWLEDARQLLFYRKAFKEHGGDMTVELKVRDTYNPQTPLVKMVLPDKAKMDSLSKKERVLLMLEQLKALSKELRFRLAQEQAKSSGLERELEQVKAELAAANQKIQQLSAPEK